jgi:hypothetical protein
VGLKDRDLRIARTRNEVYASEQAAVYPGAVNPFHTGGYRRMAVSYECEHCNTRTAPPSGGQCIFQTKGSFARLSSLVPKPRAHGGTANFALECESELDKTRRCAARVF